MYKLLRCGGSTDISKRGALPYLEENCQCYDLMARVPTFLAAPEPVSQTNYLAQRGIRLGEPPKLSWQTTAMQQE